MKRLREWLWQLTGAAAALAELEAEKKDLQAALHMSHLTTTSVRQRLVGQTRRVRELEEWKARFDRRRR